MRTVPSPGRTRAPVLSDDSPDFFRGRAAEGIGGPPAGTGFMRESIDCGDASRFTRKWFAWANRLVGELVLEVRLERPALLRRAL